MYESWNKGVRAVYTSWDKLERIGSVNYDTLIATVFDQREHKNVTWSLRKEVQYLINTLGKMPQDNTTKKLIKRLSIFNDLLIQYHLIKKYRKQDGYTITLLNHKIFLKKNDFMKLSTLDIEREYLLELLKNNSYDIPENKRNAEINILEKHII